MDAGNLIVISLWGVLAVSVTWQLSRHGAATFDDRFAPADRRLVGRTARYLTVPALALVSHLTQLGLVRALGGEARFETWIYWSVLDLSLADPHLEAAVAAAGPLTLLVFAALLLGWTRAFPSRAAVNQLRLETASLLLLLAFGVGPLASLLAQAGDIWTIRVALDQVHDQAGEAALLGYGVLAAFSFWRWREARRLRALGSPLHDAMRRARERVERDPEDAEARIALGAAQLASGDPDAIPTLEKARADAGDDPRVRLLLGRAYLEGARPRDAAACLRDAGVMLEERGDRPDLLLEVTLALGAARIAQGDAEGAILTAEAARDAAPRDPRALLMLADALVLGGQIDDARRRLEAALDQASGALRAEIRRRLAALER